MNPRVIFRPFLAAFALLVIASVLVPNDLEAQEIHKRKHDDRLLHFGMSIGFNQAQFKLTHSDAFAYHDSIKVVDSPNSSGFNVGIVSALHLNKFSELRFIPTLTFAEKDLRYTEISSEGDVEHMETVESIILQFPLTFKYKSDRFFNNFRFYVIGGARFDWDLASDSKARKANTIIKIGPNDFLAEYGFGLEFYTPMVIVSPQIKISHGLTNVHIPTEGLRYSDVLGGLRGKYIAFTIQFEG